MINNPIGRGDGAINERARVHNVNFASEKYALRIDALDTKATIRAGCHWYETLSTIKMRLPKSLVGAYKGGSDVVKTVFKVLDIAHEQSMPAFKVLQCIRFGRVARITGRV